MLELPAHSRPHAAEVPDRVPLTGFVAEEGASFAADPAPPPAVGDETFGIETEHGVRVPMIGEQAGEMVAWRRAGGRGGRPRSRAPPP